MKPARISLRSDNEQNWRKNNPVLLLGEPGYDTDNGHIRIGNGTTPWNMLAVVGYALGPKGDTGVQGIQGQIGPKGDRGIQGVIGPKGDTGIQGIQGQTGPKGDRGIQGLIGAKGDTGIQGVQGIQGIQGVMGLKGCTGSGLPSGHIFTAGSNYGHYHVWNDSTATWVIGTKAVTLGTGAGEYEMEGSVAIGEYAGNTNQGEHSVAIGSFAGKNDQSANSIVLNASGDELNTLSSGLFIKPIRQCTNPAGGVSGSLWYNPETSEICYN